MKIKSSKRGLTFSFQENKVFRPGTHYRYFVDWGKQEVLIVPDQNGMKISRKKTRQRIKPLVDLRNKEIRKFISGSDFFEIIISENQIIVRNYERNKLSLSFLHRKRYTIENILEIKKKDEIKFSQSLIQDAVGCEFEQMTISSYLASLQADINQKKSLRTVFDVVSFFSGAGMLDLPFHNDPCFNIRFAIDHNGSACDTYRHNIGNHILCGSMLEIESFNVPKSDVVIGGISCKPYSNSNRKKRLNDNNDYALLESYLKGTRIADPDVFVIENVPYFIKANDGEQLEKIMDAFSEYEITTKIVKDCELGGYTLRKRCIIIGSKIGSIHLPDTRILPMKTVKDALQKVNTTWIHYNDISRSKKETIEKMEHVRPGHNFRDIPKEIYPWTNKTQSNTYHRLSMDEQSPALPNWRKARILPPAGNRILSVAEAAALSGLTNSFQFFGTLNDKQQQIGNGVPQSIANIVYHTIKKALLRHQNELGVN